MNVPALQLVAAVERLRVEHAVALAHAQTSALFDVCLRRARPPLNRAAQSQATTLRASGFLEFSTMFE